jgi:hypothetical protein
VKGKRSSAIAAREVACVAPKIIVMITGRGRSARASAETSDTLWRADA